MEKLKEFLLDNLDKLENVVRELNSWNGSLEHLDVYENEDDFFNTFFEGRIMEAVRASYYGDYRYMDAYVRFNACGNLESISKYQYERELKEEIDEIIALLIENRNNLNLDREIEELLDEVKEEE